MREQEKKGLEFIQSLIQKSWESPEFKEQLVKNPVLTLETITGKKAIHDKKIVVEDQTNEAIIYLNIPAKPDFSELELTEEELEMVAGGLTPAAYVAGFVIGAACTYVVGKYLL